MTSGMSASQLTAVQIRKTRIANLMSAPSRTGGATRPTVIARLAAARSNELGDRWIDRKAAAAALDDDADSERGSTALDDDVDSERKSNVDGRNTGCSRSSTNTELPQFVQNERVGSTPRPHDAHTIGRYPTPFV